MSEDYKLVWEDNFNGDKLSLSDWEYETHEAGWIANELQEYVAGEECAYIENGKLVINPIRVNNEDGTTQYKSSRISTKPFHSFKYGKFEARIKVPQGEGLIPAFRLIPVDESAYGPWPECGEIDVMEVVRHVPGRVYGTLTYGFPISSRRYCTDINEGNLSDDYHVFGCEWLPGEVRFLLDGKVYATANNWYACDEGAQTPHPYPAPFNKEFFIILTVSIGGLWAGEPDISTFYDDRSKMEVDWIRVYQLPEYDENVVQPARNVELRESDETGNFINGAPEYWEFMNFNNGKGNCVRGGTGGEEIIINTENQGTTDYSIQLVQNNIPLTKGFKYMMTFDAMADTERSMVISLSNPQAGWKRLFDDTHIALDTHWQTHTIFFDMTNETIGDARLEFNCGAADSLAQIRIKNVRFEMVEPEKDTRKLLAVCGVWEDADNFNAFLRSLQTPIITDDYVIGAFSFGIVNQGLTPEAINVEFAKFVDKFDLGGIVIFCEMIKSQVVVDMLIDTGSRLGIPVFALERPQVGCINVVLDYKGGFRQMTEHLVEDHGYNDILMMAGYRGNSFSEERIAVFKEVMAIHGLPNDDGRILYGDFWDTNAVKEFKRYLAQGNKLPRAIICANDSMAIGMADYLEYIGYSVPDDVAVTGFDGMWASFSHDPAISTCAPDYESIVSFIADTLRSGKIDEEDKVIGFKLKLDRSCGCSEIAQPHEMVKQLSRDNQDFFRHSNEMGRFVSRTIGMTDMDEAMETLPEYLWLWTNQYYLASLFTRSGVHALLEDENGEYKFNRKYYNYPTPVPSMRRIFNRDSGYNIVLFKHIYSQTGSLGYVLNAFERIKLRQEQRFEEFCQYCNAVVNGVINNKRLLKANADIVGLSQKDYLTGLYNRRGFMEKLNEMIEDPENKGRVLSLFSIDMNGLKFINDNYGHKDGDLSIQILAKAIRSFVGSRGISARYGGDEFAVAIVGDYELLPEYQEIHNRICDQSKAEAEMLGKPYPVTASIGIAERIVRDGLNIEDMIAIADNAMYVDKQRSKIRR